VSDEASGVTASEDTSVERLLSVGKKRGRPPGSKNRPKDDDDGPPRVNQSIQIGIFATALIALFAVIGAIAGWFGYEQYESLSSEEAEEGGKCLVPIAAKIGWIATAAFYLSFPAWLIAKLPKKFRKKVEPTAVAAPGMAASQANGSYPPGDSAVRNPAPIGSPSQEDSFLKPLQ
jgi:hypothetical protein